MQGSSKIHFANTLRGFAALSVLVSHYFGVFWSSRAAVEAITNAPALPVETHVMPNYISWLHVFPIFNWGAYGVALFFIISGFVIPFSLKKMNWRGFVVNRIFRIIPTYFVGFTITLLAIMISGSYFSREWPFNVRDILIHYIPGIRDVLWSRGIDGIVWTLEIEMKFYLICAALIVWFRKESLKVFFAPVALFLIALWINKIIPGLGISNSSAWQLAMTYMTVSQYVIYMFIGVIFHYLYSGNLDPNKGYLGIGGLFAMFCIHWWSGPYSANLPVAWSYAFALLTFTFAYSFPNIFNSNRLFEFLADISYPLYVIHGVAGYVALRIMLEKGFKAWLALLVVTASCLIFSWLLHVGVESPSQKLGKKLGLKLSGRLHLGKVEA